MGRRGCAALEQHGAVAALIDMLAAMAGTDARSLQRMSDVSRRVCCALVTVAARHPSRALIVNRHAHNWITTEMEWSATDRLDPHANWTLQACRGWILE